MKKSLLFALTLCFGSGLTLNAQNSDDPMFISEISKPINTTIYQTKSGVPVSGTTVATCDSGSTTLSVTGGCGAYEWYSDSLGANSLGTTDLITGMLYDDTTFYISYQGPSNYDTAAPLPGHGSVFTGNIRGYWFQAPVDFYITGATVPTDASTGLSTIAIVKFNSGPPPNWSATTNDFTVLEYWVEQADDTLFTCHQVLAGEWIGVLGWRGTSNSYAGAPYTSSIAGNPVTFTRLGMQYNLNTTAPQELFSEPSGSLSRTELLYSTTLTSGSVLQPVDVYVPKSTEETVVFPNLCDGETYFAEGTNQTTSGMYHDTLSNVIGCDSIVHHDITFNPSYDYSNHFDLCDGDSIFLQGAWQTGGGIFYDTLQTIGVGCDSIITTTVFLANNPVASVDPFSQDTICLQSSPIALPSGSPSGGTYSGAGVSGSNFDPSMASTGDVSVVYTVTNGFNCSDSDTATIHVIDCTSLDEESLEGVNIFPNPSAGLVNLNFDFNLSSDVLIELFDNQGKLVYRVNSNNKQNQIDLSSFADGIYVLHVKHEDKHSRTKITKH
jgi:hypothetical protein